MKIAQIAPLYEAVPPKLYGGTERVVAQLCDALVDLGHEVTLFASADAVTRAKLVPVRDQAIRLDPAPLKSDMAAHLTMLAEVRARRTDFDIIHFHTDMLHFPFFEDMAARTVTTLHGRLDLKDLPGGLSPLAEVPAGVDLGRPAHRTCRSPTGSARSTTACRPTCRPGSARAREGYLAFLGRMSPEKGPDRAIAHRQAPRHAAEDGRQGRSGRLGLLPRRDRAAAGPSADRVHRRDRRRRRSRTSSAAPRRCCSRSTGPSRSAW